MMKKILIALVAVIAVLLVVIATRPSTFQIERSATIAAPAEVVFASLNDFHRWSDWSPWEKIDPNMKRTFEGAASGVGAIYGWTGNDEVGEGRMTITESKPAEKIGIKLEFIKPWSATNQTVFTLKPAGDKVSVTWTMSGTNGFMMKAFSMFMNMDEMVGKDFEKGLASLATVAQAEAKKQQEEAAKAAEMAKAAEAAPAEGAAPAAAAPAANP